MRAPWKTDADPFEVKANPTRRQGIMAKKAAKGAKKKTAKKK